MSKGVAEAWVEALNNWAEKNEFVVAGYLFGSRVKGSFRSDSDLDFAVTLYSTSEEPFTVWIYENRGWHEQLARLLPDVQVHLQMTSPDDQIVWPAIQDHGRQIYPRPPMR